jgi:hypothetical protein
MADGHGGVEEGWKIMKNEEKQYFNSFTESDRTAILALQMYKAL